MTDKYAVIGNPISHSKSPLIHRMFAEQTGQDISYEALEAPLDGFAAKIEELRAKGYKGCNVTVPFKQNAYDYALNSGMTCELPATTAQAVNTLSINNSRATNTDGIGLVRDIRSNLSCSLDQKRILLMGAGGAARGVLYPLMDQTSFMSSQQSPARIIVANRTPNKADVLVNELTNIINEQDFQLIAARIDSTKPRTTQLAASSYEELAGQQFDIVINATSAGLSDSSIPLPDTIFAPGALAYDMMYGRETPFMAFARTHGARVADGLGMLVEQAAEAFFIWRGVRPDTRPVLEKLRAA